ncbi:hypothetical protein H2201_007268 [Coniosporium apollinis]|uniref:Uncharacterized protein n=2 Tax=Coniosporium TaxID=2810619 RepID=A0ABQ9NNR4_9PEZI|nr:hypothetical protein H2199_001006 [Cladosporium sp. JES 115]KAJ9659677.1 hypothetical protein H2201_007268 [Coniosporium apollinis]
MAEQNSATQTSTINENMNPSALSAQSGKDQTSLVEDDRNDFSIAEALCNQEDSFMPTAEHATELIVETVKEGAKGVASVVSNIAATIVDKVEKAADDRKDSALGPYSDHATTAPSDMDPVGEAVLLGLDMNGDGEIRRG